MHDRKRGGQRGFTILQRMAALAIVGIVAAVAFARCGEPAASADAANPTRAAGLPPAAITTTPDALVDWTQASN